VWLGCVAVLRKEVFMRRVHLDDCGGFGEFRRSLVQYGGTAVGWP
jgi:hypothetical protein